MLKIGHYFESERGIALIAALIASLLLLALGMLVISMATGDLKTSAQTVADKKAVAASDKGLNRLTQKFKGPEPYTQTNYKTEVTPAKTGDSAFDSSSQYTIDSVTDLNKTMNMTAGFGEGYGMVLYSADITGVNTSYNSRVSVTAGLGYGPVKITPEQ